MRPRDTRPRRRGACMTSGTHSPRSPLLVVMGVSGSGKTTTGEALAARLGLDYADADGFHPRRTWRRWRPGTRWTTPTGPRGCGRSARGWRSTTASAAWSPARRCG
nr:shikimate kinase [Angustibacter aerolatus]